MVLRAGSCGTTGTEARAAPGAPVRVAVRPDDAGDTPKKNDRRWPRLLRRPPAPDSTVREEQIEQDEAAGNAEHPQDERLSDLARLAEVAFGFALRHVRVVNPVSLHF